MIGMSQAEEASRSLTIKIFYTANMGSGNKRKGNDVLRVNRPQKPMGSGEGNGHGGSSVSEDINQLCPQAFVETIKPKGSVPNDTRVSIEGRDLFVMDENVGKLSESHLQIITKCGGKGIRYIGRVLNKGTKTYARFQQITQG
jgi:hypothetical protein